MAKTKRITKSKAAPVAKQETANRRGGCSLRNIILIGIGILVLSAIGRGSQGNSTRATQTARQQVAQVQDDDATNTPRPTRARQTWTPRPSVTPTDEDDAAALQEPSATSGSRATSTITSTATRQPVTNTSVPTTAAPTIALTEAEPEVFQTPLSERTYYIRNEARVRSCPSTSNDCAVVTNLTSGTAITVIGIALGDTVSGSREWYMIEQSGVTRYVHSSLVSTSLVSSGSTGGISTGGGSGGSGSNPGGSLPINTQVVVSTPPPNASFVCDCSRTCSAPGMTCEEAYFQLNQCGCSQRDGDNPPDGIPCENLCL
jgi:Tfp pilus assembly protein FimT